MDHVYSVKSDNSKLHLHQSRRFSSIFISVESWLHQFKEHIYLKNNINVFNYKSIISLIIIIIISIIYVHPCKVTWGHYYLFWYMFTINIIFQYLMKKYWWMLYVCAHYSPLWVRLAHSWPQPPLGPMSMWQFTNY